MSENDYKSALMEMPAMNPSTFGEKQLEDDSRNTIRWAEQELAKMRKGKK